jgi:hypothetical protein
MDRKQGAAMPTLFDPSARGKIVSRLSGLTPDRRPLWGSLDAPRLQTHLADQLRMTLGDIHCRSKGGRAFRTPPLRELLIYIVPFPKGLPTAPELLASAPADFEADRQTLLELIGRVGTRKPGESWGEHPAFGPISRRAWGVLGWRHLDHHLRQFGL